MSLDALISPRGATRATCRDVVRSRRLCRARKVLIASILWAGVVACGGSGSASGAASGGSTAPAPAPSPPTSPTGIGAPLSGARFFVTGHSLTDNPLVDDIAAIARSLGMLARYNQQISIASTINYRTRGAGPTWDIGKNREGSGMNVVRELRQPQTIDGDRYDTLIITERHDLVSVVIWENTVRHLRHFHERLIEGNPAARTYFYESWADVSDKDDPRAWIAHERGASVAWQCVATRVNTSLQAEGRTDRLTPLPVGAAIAELVERATQGAGVAGVTGNSVRETVDRIFSDSVHMTRLGVYYVALINYAAIYRRSPEGAWAPSGVTATQARSLQQAAWDFVSRFYRDYAPRNLEQCRAYMRDSFCATYSGYRGLSATEFANCGRAFSRESIDNPLYFDPARDATYWFPAPP